MSHGKILYLGLRPKPNTFHYPVIRTVRCDSLEEPLRLWPQFTHVIATSQTTVEYWPGPWDKEWIAIGETTAGSLRKRGVSPHIAPVATQEGIIEFVKHLPAYFFVPHSKKARPSLLQALPHKFAFELYDTHLQCIEPIPDLNCFETIVFTSPSTVDGFLQIYGHLPKNKKLMAQGPITKQKLLEQDILLQIDCI